MARAYHVVRHARIGVMGHVYEGMLDMNSDPTMFDAAFGLHCEHVEMDDLQACVDEVTPAEVEHKLDEVHTLFAFPTPGADPIAGPAGPNELRWAATVACGLERLVQRFNLTGLAYYYRGLGGNAYEKLGSSFMVGGSLLTGRGVPLAGELDIKNCLAMLLLDRLEAGGSFCEIHPCDFDSDIVLVGHDGPHHIAVAQGQPVLRGLSIKTEVHYPVPPHKQKAMQGVFGEATFPVSEEIHKTIVSLPLSFGHKLEEIEYVIEVMNRFE